MADGLQDAEKGEAEEPGKKADEAEDKDKPPLCPNTSVNKRRPSPLDLSSTRRSLPSPLPSSLTSARIIDDINHIDYPGGIKGPKVELNVNANPGKFRFVAICSCLLD